METKKMFLVAGIVIVLLATGGSALTGFWDSVIVEDNEVVAASLMINDTVLIPFFVDNMKPGDNITTNMSIENAGTIPGNLTVQNIAVSDPENTLLSPEIKAGDAPNTDLGGDAFSGYGELDNLITVEFEVNGTVIYSGTGLQTEHLFDYTLGPGEEIQLNMTVEWPKTTVDNIDNTAQSDSAKWDMEFLLYQV
ncbi:MAG: hypothetical protein WBC21_01690 [Minisyncoccales bacterium]